MSIHQYQTEQKLPVSVGQAWEFFSSPMNLARITPPGMDFKVLTTTDLSKIYSGLRIRYSVKPLLGIPVIWETRIADVNEPFSFIDLQEKGPYALWEHTHTFTEIDGGVLMKDKVRYELPFGFLGDLAHVLIVKNRIREIFKYRYRTLNKIFA